MQQTQDEKLQLDRGSQEQCEQILAQGAQRGRGVQSPRLGQQWHLNHCESGVCVWEGLHADSSDIAKLTPPAFSEVPPLPTHWQLCQGAGPGEPMNTPRAGCDVGASVQVRAGAVQRPVLAHV